VPMKGHPVARSEATAARSSASSGTPMKDFGQLIAEGRSEAAASLVEIRDDLHRAWECATKAMRRLWAGDLNSARYWADRACDFEYRALGECECYGHIADALGDDCRSCGFRAGNTTQCPAREGRPTACRMLECLPQCECAGCNWIAGDVVRSVTGSGVVLEVTVDGRAWAEWLGQMPSTGQWVWRVWSADREHP
jgi:hypothetical protein